MEKISEELLNKIFEEYSICAGLYIGLNKKWDYFKILNSLKRVLREKGILQEKYEKEKKTDEKL